MRPETTLSFKLLKNFNSVLGQQLIIIPLILGLIGCATQGSTVVSITEPIPAPVIQTENLQNEILRLEKLIAEKDAQIKNQQNRQQNQANVLKEVNKEVTRAQVKLHRLATKPSTASAIAETEVALEHLKQEKITSSDQILQIQAQRLLEIASVYYAKDEYAVAMNYISQANQLISLIVDQNQKKVVNLNHALIEFHTPMILRTKTKVNLRKEPNGHAQILSTLKKDTTLAANANLGSWLRVSTNGSQGWVLNTMLEPEEKENYHP